MNEYSLKSQIKNIAIEKRINPTDCWKKLFLERFLSRLSRSAYNDKLIFKGGFLLSYIIQLGRETSDLDFTLKKMNGSEEGIKNAMDEICSVKSEDGFSFKYSGQETLSHAHGYAGSRVNLDIVFGNLRERIAIDISIGDVVQPIAREFNLFQYRGKPIFEDEISLMVYPVETIFAEKLDAILCKGEGNTRMKDYHDLYLLIRESYVINKEKLKECIKNTFSHRKTDFRYIEFSPKGIFSLERLWGSHLKNIIDSQQYLNMPQSILDVIETINLFTKDLKL